jgi:hypothetical protein
LGSPPHRSMKDTSFAISCVEYPASQNNV